MESPSYSSKVASEVRVGIARAGMTAKEVATLAGLSEATLSRKLRGQVPFNVDDLGRLAAALDVMPASFLPEAVAA